MKTTYETGASNHVVNDIVLTVINDGDGSQCGMTYQQRCASVDKPHAYNRAAWIYHASATPTEIKEAAALLLAYYREHTKELA